MFHFRPILRQKFLLKRSWNCSCCDLPKTTKFLRFLARLWWWWGTRYCVERKLEYSGWLEDPKSTQKTVCQQIPSYNYKQVLLEDPKDYPAGSTTSHISFCLKTQGVDPGNEHLLLTSLSVLPQQALVSHVDLLLIASHPSVILWLLLTVLSF